MKKLYNEAIPPVLHSQTARFTRRNGPFEPTKQAVLQCKTAAMRNPLWIK